MKWLQIIALLNLSCSPISPSRPPHSLPGVRVPPVNQTQSKPRASGTLRFVVQFDAAPHLSLTSAEEEYNSTVHPIMVKSCLTGNCHTQTEYINLEQFPYKAEGSFVMQKIHSELGHDYDVNEAQALIVQELISSIETLYMPPFDSEAEPVDEAQLAVLRNWAERGVPDVEQFEQPTLTLNIAGYSGEKRVCATQMNLNLADKTTLVEVPKCHNVEKVYYEVSDARSTVLREGYWEVGEVMKGEILKIAN